MKKMSITVMFLIPLALFAQSEWDIQKMISHKQYSSAATKGNELIKNQPQNFENWYWLSQVYLQQKDSINLVAMKSRLPQQANNDAWVAVTMGNIALATGDIATARNSFDKAVSLTRARDKNILAAVARINIYSDKGDKQYAIDQLKKAIKRNKKDAPLHTLTGEAYFRLKNGNEAYKSLTKALEYDAGYAPALYALGMIFTTQNNEPVYLEYFNKTIAADPAFAPALYQLYYHYYSKDIDKAYSYFTRYKNASDPDLEIDYQLADMLYLTKQYREAIAKADELLSREDAKNRMHKLKAYIYKEIGAPDSAILFMNQYFANGADTSYLLKDYEFMVGVYKDAGIQDSVIAYQERSLPLIKDDAAKRTIYKAIADHFKDKKDYTRQSEWLARYYDDNSNATNVDLFNWGLSLYQSQQFSRADSVFGYYGEKYPEHVYGFYWQARSRAAIDSTMDQGIAIPVYQKLIEMASLDTANETNRRYLVEAYGYMASYAANQEKNYPSAIEYFEKLLELDPANNDAKRYVDILEDAIDSAGDSKK